MASTTSLPQKICESCGQEVGTEGGKLEVRKFGLTETFHFCWHCIPERPDYWTKWTR